MGRVRRLIGVGLATALAVGCGGEPQPPAPATTTTAPARPLARDAAAGMNLVVVLSDALRAANLPWHGYPRATAPHLGALARESVVFDAHVAHFPGTPVSVSQMFTSRLMAPLLMSYRYMAVAVRDLPADLPVLPQLLREQGYRTMLVSSHPWFDDESRLRWFFDDWRLEAAAPDESYAPFEQLLPPVRAALDAVEAGRPFFLYVHSMDTHGPNHLRPEHAVSDPFGTRPEDYAAYDAEIHYTDHWVGALVDELRERGLWGRTVFVFTSDHGEEFGELGPEPWNRNHGLQVRKPLVHVPMLLRIPGDPRPGRHVAAVTGHVDLVPTLLGLLAPAAETGTHRFDGVDLGPVVRGAAPADATRTLAAWSPRYWGAYGSAGELHYDPWDDATTPLLAATPDAQNYPRLAPAADQAAAAELAAFVRAEFARRTDEWVGLPPNPELAATTHLAMPMWIEPGEPPPTFTESRDDGRWHLPGRYLGAHPGEQPGPVTLRTPWVPGRYRVRLILESKRLRAGWANQVRVHVVDPANTPVEVDGAAATDEARIDLGVQTVGEVLRVRVSDPVGGVSIAGIELERIDRPTDRAPGDGGLRERLRRLGYIAE